MGLVYLLRDPLSASVLSAEVETSRGPVLLVRRFVLLHTQYTSTPTKSTRHVRHTYDETGHDLRLLPSGRGSGLAVGIGGKGMTEAFYKVGAACVLCSNLCPHM